MPTLDAELEDNTDKSDAPVGPLLEPPVEQPLTKFEPDTTPETSHDDLTRPLAGSGLEKIAAGVSDADLTRPLDAPMPGRLELVASDAELTRPLPPAAPVASASLPPLDGSRLPLPPPPTSRAPRPAAPPMRPLPMIALPPPPVVGAPQVPLIVAVPPRSVGAVEQAPSIQIAEPTLESSYAQTGPRADAGLPGSPSSRSRQPTSPRLPSVRVPAFSASRPARSSYAPVAGSIPPPHVGGRQGGKVVLAVLGFAAAAAAVVGLRLRPASLVVTVAGPNGAAPRAAQVLVDGIVQCERTPCELPSLSSGTHLIGVAAAGYAATAERAVALSPGEHAAHHVTLELAEPTAASLAVAAEGDGLHVFVDGKDLGAPPVTLRDVEPGVHAVRVEGRAGTYQPYEETFSLEAGEVRNLGPVHLRLLRGRLELRAGGGVAPSRVTVDGRSVADLPAVVELGAERTHEVVAYHRGFAPFRQEIAFEGAAQRSLEIELVPLGGAGIARAATASKRPAPVTAQRNVTARSAALPTHAATTGSATLDLNSTPRASVVLNGRPLGMTPVRGVRVQAGPQTVVFIHRELGRKMASATVRPGARAAVAVKF